MAAQNPPSTSYGTPYEATTEPGNICYRCSAIPWDSPYGPHDTGFVTISESVEVLQVSTCRICRFLARSIMMHKHLHADRYVLCWKNKRYIREDRYLWGSQLESNLASCIALLSNNTSWHPLLTTNRASVMETNFSIESLRPAFLNFENVKKLIRNCESGHTRCRSQGEKRLKGLRLIDCERRVVIDIPKDDRLGHPPFVALSYVWGSTTHRLNSINLDESKSVPKTIQHSILATTSLGYRYLWIDRFVRRGS